MPRIAKRLPCLGEWGWCTHCEPLHKAKMGTTKVLGHYCLDGWRKEARSINTFFVETDGSPCIRIANEERFAQEQYKKQQKAMKNFQNEK
jgi:hypothetical protein